MIYSHFESIFRLNDVGRSAIHADVTGSGLNSTNDRGIWLDGSGGIALVACEGIPAPGMPSGVKFSFMGPSSSMALNDSGQIAFRGGLTVAGVNSTNNDSIYLAGSGGLALVAREGSQAPGTSSDVNFASGFSSALSLNNAGQMAFDFRLTGSGVDTTNNGGIWSDRSGSLALVARIGDKAPGAPIGVTYTGFGNTNSFALNDAGQMAFASVVTGSGVDSTNNVGIWSEGSGSLVLVARKGDHAPGTPDGVVFSSMSFSSTSFVFLLNSAGRIAFNAELTDSGGAFAGYGFWATDRDGDLQLIACYGDLLEVAPGDVRTISGFINPVATTSTGNNNSRPSWFNDLGQLAFLATFTDGSSGIFVSNRVAVPEPAALPLAALGLVALMLQHRHSPLRSQQRISKLANTRGELNHGS